MRSAASEPAYYAKKIAAKSFERKLSASGRLVFDGPKFHVLVGFFNSGTVNEWRTPNTIAIRLLGRGDVYYAVVEYATSGRTQLKGFKTGVPVEWSIQYDPVGNGGSGSIAVTLGGETSVCHLAAGHKADGATFDRFGLLTAIKSPDDSGEVWLDDIAIDGQTDHLARNTG